MAAAQDHPAWTRRGRVIWGGNLHEPLAFYRRENRLMAGVAAQGLWLEEWYKKVRSERTIEQLAELGVNLLYVNFAKGAGDPEYEDRAGTKRLVATCRRHGIRTLAYIQFACPITESLLIARPEARNWLARDRFGRPQLYGGNRYYRQRMCPANPAYIEYVKTLIREALVDYDMDGVFLDNFYYRPCYCDHCQRRFREYLRERFPDPLASLGVADLRGVRIPEVESRETVITDRLHQAWASWRMTVLPEVAESLRRYVRSIDPDAALCANICYPRMDNWSLRGADPRRFLRTFDISYAEASTSFPRWENGQAVSNALVLLMGADAGGNVLPGAWLPGLQLPERADQIELCLGESLAFGGHVLAGIWALRMKGRKWARNEQELSEPYFTRPEVAGTWARYNRFLLDHPQLYIGSTLDCPVAIYHSAASMTYDFGVAYAAFVNASQSLLQARVPFAALFSEELSRLNRYRVLWVPSQRCLSDEEIAAMEEFVRGGGRLIVTGWCGLYDQFRRERRDFGLNDLTGASLFGPRPRDGTSRASGKGETVFFPSAPELAGVNTRSSVVKPTVPNAAKQVVEAVRRQLGPALKLQVEAPPSVLMAVFKTADGATVTHLLNYNNREPLRDVPLIAPAGSPLRSSTPKAFSPDGPHPATLTEQSPGCWVLAELKTYTCVMWDREE
ncbi:MAG: hypothetical protein GXP27_14115 [Planctomycetes bacterium]|nr:hypothetical protein [Planctomycetota bacterium]